MLLAKKMAKKLGQVGVRVLDYEESKDPKYMDGEVTLENELSVQVGCDYACLCVIEEEKIDYLLEKEDLTDETGFATEVASFIKKGQL
jgi:hypothetical protein